MFDSVLVVCTGNICRSPMGEFLLRKRWNKPGAKVASAGVGALVGYPADDLAIAVMDEQGVDMREHRAQQLVQPMVSAYDLILVMEKSHQSWINERLPISRGRVHAMTKWLSEEEVPDPYRQGRMAFEQCYQQLDVCVNSWLERIS